MRVSIVFALLAATVAGTAGAAGGGAAAAAGSDATVAGGHACGAQAVALLTASHGVMVAI